MRHAFVLESMASLIVGCPVKSMLILQVWMINLVSIPTLVSRQIHSLGLEVNVQSLKYYYINDHLYLMVTFEVNKIK